MMLWGPQGAVGEVCTYKACDCVSKRQSMARRDLAVKEEMAPNSLAFDLSAKLAIALAWPLHQPSQTALCVCVMNVSMTLALNSQVIIYKLNERERARKSTITNSIKRVTEWWQLKLEKK